MIRLEGVGKRYADGTVAVQDLSLSVGAGELVALVGPSGCGKSTTLRLVNRLIEPTSGRIFIDGRDVTSVDPVRLRRGIGYVIQQTGLFPHQSVRANVGTVPQLLGWDRARVAARVDELLRLVGLDPARYANRYPHELSGGQRQRVGVARALAADPPVLLMDEPFGAVDPVVRDRLQGEFRRIQGELHKTVLFVTHDIDEAVRLGDRIAVFTVGGRLEQVADPVHLLSAPASEAVAEFVGSDRGLRRLAVTPIRSDDLRHPPTVSPHDGAAEAARMLLEQGSDWAVVVDDAGVLHGWVARRALGGPAHPLGAGPVGATVADRAHRFAETAELGDSLRRGFSAIVQHDLGWLPVVEEGQRYVGVLTPEAVHAALRRGVPTEPVQPLAGG